MQYNENTTVAINQNKFGTMAMKVLNDRTTHVVKREEKIQLNLYRGIDETTQTRGVFTAALYIIQ